MKPSPHVHKPPGKQGMNKATMPDPQEEFINEAGGKTDDWPMNLDTTEIEEDRRRSGAATEMTERDEE